MMDMVLLRSAFTRAFVCAFAGAVLAPLSACNEEPQETDLPDAVNQDPLLARALNDPLMIDPDLASRNEANAIIAFRDGHPLPPITANADARDQAHEATRLQLLEGGPIPTLAPVSDGEGQVSFADLTTAEDLLEASAGPKECIGEIEDGLIWSTRMPETSAIMPHGMVQQAAGVDRNECVIRVVRYLTPADASEVLEYHFVIADRNRFRIERFSEPEAILKAERRDQEIVVHARPGPGGMTAVDVLHWRK